MRVSIVIPCFRQAHFLKCAVESCLAQTHADVETIVVNDGSDDDTAGVAAAFGRRITCLARENGGLPSARNAGLSAATGRACVFLDADDALAPRAVEWLVAAAADHENALCVMGYRTFLRSPAETDGMERIPPADTPPLPLLIHDNFGPPHSYLAPTELLRSIGGFDEALPPGCEDWDAWMRLVLAGAELRAVQRVGALYRDAPGSMSKSLPRMLVSRAAVLLKTHRALAADRGTLFAYAVELLKAEQRVMRRLYAHRIVDPVLIGRFVAARAELEAAGFRLPATTSERALRALFGSASERVYVALSRVLRRNWYEFYRSGYV